MCGRYASTQDPATLAAEFDAQDATDGDAPTADYNVAPTKPVLTVVQRHPRDEEGNSDPDTTVRSIRVMRWGLVPAWAKDKSVGAKMINARSESAATKPAFRTSVAKRRCLIPADGWYEWRREGTAKQPFFMTASKGVVMAGLWTVWRDKADPDAEPLVSCAVVTTDSVGQLTEIHDRMPLLLPEKSYAAWLDPDSDDVSSLLAPPSADLVGALELRPVADTVNNVRNNGPELMVRHEPATEPDLFSLDQ